MVGGGDHCKSAGGYSGGAGEPYNLGNVNGLCTIYGSGGGLAYTSLGGGYYTYNTIPSIGASYWFGLGGCHSGIDDPAYSKGWSAGGSGGIAGSGGTVKYSENATIHAYNGDRVTNDDYTTTYYQYDKDGNSTSTVANVITKPNGSKLVPALIYIQDGIKRAVYNYPCYMSNELLSMFSITRDTIKVEKTLISAEQLGVEHFSQGIGSGAGYIEISNGTYEVDPSLN